MLDEPISEEAQQRLRPSLRPQPFQPIAPPRKRDRRQQLLRQFDPFPPQNIQNVTDYQNEIINLYDVAKFDGEESKGRRYKRWRFIKDLNEDLTPKFMEKIRVNVWTSFYLFFFIFFLLFFFNRVYSDKTNTTTFTGLSYIDTHTQKNTSYRYFTYFSLEQ